MKHRKLLHSIFATVAYGDVFDYPLTQEELIRWSIGGTLRVPSGGIEKKNGFVIVRGRTQIISLRKRRAQIAQKKWKRIDNIARVFRLIPTVTLMGVTGGLAMNNARKNDDIDLFFITHRNTLWVTRMLTAFLAEILMLRRRPNDTRVEDKMCLNMFVSEDSLELSEDERDLFSAHEVLQMVPLWERGGVYSKFLKANKWVKEYLPNAWGEKIYDLRMKNHEQKQKQYWFLFFMQLLEPIARNLQLWYMKKRRTNEVIRSGMIRFHPRDARVWVREKFGLRLEKLNIPLDKIFFRR